MRKFLVFLDDNRRHELAPLSYAEFMALGLWQGASDMAYKAWKYHNNVAEVDDFRTDALKRSTIEIEFTTQGNYMFNPSGDGDTWINCSPVMRGNQPLRKPDPQDDDEEE